MERKKEQAEVKRVVMPDIPSKWVSRKYGTRHVIDRTLGGDVVYIQGRIPVPFKEYMAKTCTLSEWNAYQQFAKKV